MQTRTVLITGAARRIGAEIARTLHAAGMNVVIHCHRSVAQAEQLRNAFNSARAGSAAVCRADLLDADACTGLIEAAAAAFDGLDALVNNASVFRPTPVAEASLADWEEIVNSNLRAPFLLAQAAAGQLRARRGCIVNIGDIHGLRPLRNHAIYSTAKAGQLMLTQALAKELAPEVRVNAVAPGAVLWPEEMDAALRERIVAHTMLRRAGEPGDVAAAVRFLVLEADYVTGQVITVDGGRMLYS